MREEDIPKVISGLRHGGVVVGGKVGGKLWRERCVFYTLRAILGDPRYGSLTFASHDAIAERYRSWHFFSAFCLQARWRKEWVQTRANTLPLGDLIIPRLQL